MDGACEAVFCLGTDPFGNEIGKPQILLALYACNSNQ
jgi:hypothetical protein